MTYYNNGSFTAKTQEDMVALIEILNNTILGPYKFDADDVYQANGQFCLELPDCEGDIEHQLEQIVEKCQKKNLDVEFDIHYYGDAEGGHLFKGGKYEFLSEDEFRIRQMDDYILLNEVCRRGLTQRICNDAIRSFMASELEHGYNMSPGDARRAAVLAFNHYTDSEGATQYDGIEWAAICYRSDAWIPVSRESLPEYWHDYPIVIEFADGTDALAQENGYTLHDCQHKLLDAKFYLD